MLIFYSSGRGDSSKPMPIIYGGLLHFTPINKTIKMRNFFLREIGILLLVCLFFSCGREGGVESFEVQANLPASSRTNNLDAELNSLLEAQSEGQGKSFFQFPESNDFSNIPQDPLNPLTPEKVALGKMLYHETGLAINPKHGGTTGTFSCASCHFAEAGFQADRPQGISEGGMGSGMNGFQRNRNPFVPEAMLDVQPVRSPATLNVAYQKNMLWNGQFGATGENIGTEDKWKVGTPIATNHLGVEGVEVQAIAGLGVHRLGINEKMAKKHGYDAMLKKAFPDVAEKDLYNNEKIGLAIAAYERTLLANKAPFQAWLKGRDGAMTESQKLGAIAFFGKAGCVDCHTGPALNKMEFHAIGMKDLFENEEEIFLTKPTDGAHLGRGGFTGKVEDNYKFKVPQLYNLKDSPFYGHGSSMRYIYHVVQYKNKGIPENERVPREQLASEFKPLGLTNDEVNNIADFIENALHDPALKRYVPTSVLSGQCFPFNDARAKREMECDD